MNLDDYSYIEDDRRYVNPQVSLDEQNAFINNLRNIQGQNTAEIQDQTYALGTRIPSNLGGLSGAGSYFSSRYQTPKVNSTVAGLRSAAQAQALTTALQNDIQKAQKTYNELYRKYQLNGGGTGGTGGTGGGNTVEGDVGYETPTEDNVDPNGVDTVEQKTGMSGQNYAKDTLAKEGYYYVDANGNRYDFTLRKENWFSPYGIDTFGAGGVGWSSNQGMDYLKNAVTNGAHIYTPDGVDITDKFEGVFGGEYAGY